MEKPKILVVEDEGIIAQHIENTLRALNYDVPAVVATGEEAIRNARESRPDLVLMDIVLKGRIDGFQAAEQIRHQLGIPVVYLTAHIDDATLERAKIAEPFGYLVKPFQDRELQGTIEVALYKHQMEKRLEESEEHARRISLENSVLAEIGRIISSTPKIEYIYDQFAAAAKGLIPFDRATINLFDYETRSFSIAYASGEKTAEFRIAACHPLKGSISQKMIENRSPILLTPNRLEEVEGEYPSLRGRWQAGFRSFLSAPLISGDHVIGGLHLLSRKHAAYTERDLGLIRRIADQIAGAIANAQLYTNLSKTEEALWESEHKYRRIVEMAQEGIWAIDENTQTTFVNARMAEMLGYAPEEMISQPTYSFMFQEDWADLKKRIQERREGKMERYERRFRRKDGGTLWAIVSAAPNLDESGQFQGSISMVTDITDQKQTEENLQRSQEEIMCRAREEETLAEIGRIVGSTMDIGDVYGRFAEEVKQIIPFDRIEINIINPRGGTFTNLYATGVDVPCYGKGAVSPLAASVTERITNTRSGVLVQAEAEDEAKAEQEIKTLFPTLLPNYRAGLWSMMMVPLISKDQVIATLHIQSLKIKAYTERDLRIAERIANQIAGAIANAQLFDERKMAEEALKQSEEVAKRLAQESTILAKIGQIISSTLNIEEVYEHFAEETKKLMVFDRISISILHKDKTTFSNLYVSGVPIPDRQRENVYPLADSLSGEVIKNRCGAIWNIEEEKEIASRLPGFLAVLKAGFRSTLMVPLIIQNEPIGVLAFLSRKPKTYSNHSLELAESIGTQIAGTIANAQLFNQVKQMLEALQESEKRYRVLVEALGQSGNAMVTLQDIGPKEGIIVSANEVAQKITGYSAEELGNLSWVDIVHPPMREMVLDRIRRRMRGEPMPGIYETLIRNKDGQEIPVELTATGSKIQGKPALIGFFREITQRKLLESQLVQAQKLEAIGQLAAGIAHEINTPIQYVGDNTRFFKDAFRDLNLLLQKYEELHQAVRSGTGTDGLVEEIQALSQKIDPDYLVKEIPKAITQTLEGVDRVANIVRAMKEFSHPGAKEMTAVNLNRAIENTITVARNEWKYVAEMETDLDPSLPPVPCLPGEINQVILNMIINGAHAIADALGDPPAGKGKITIRTRHDDRFAEVQIRDTGTGIPPEIQTRIFDPFFTTKQVGKGTGQGLAIAHSVIVKKHGGTIHFQTEVGQGTTFIIRLPLDPGSEPGSPSPVGPGGTMPAGTGGE